MERRATNADGTRVERRRNQRFSVDIPIEASWRGPEGETIKEDATAKNVNSQGGMLEMARYPESGGRISLLNILSAATAEARVLATPSSRKGVANGIIVELVAPSESFWGVNFQVKKANVELTKLEEFLQSEGIDPRLLKEYRSTADYLRTIAYHVQQLRRRQLREQDAEGVVAAMVAARMERITSLCLEIIADTYAGHVGRDTRDAKAADELYRCIQQTGERLHQVLKPREPETQSASRK